ncbi:OstA-like protein [Sphingobacterium composti Ten et al. 2007 non Yoo et al. 2007]|uniref:OstA-like protein n=1 Tax=Sphingobacterium composti TaxID=363260 RepID=UPI001F275A0E|nr:OstA-like protein [Sphingobacterium composti Ten et al. 2007 non Yoo et al. 2007]
MKKYISLLLFILTVQVLFGQIPAQVSEANRMNLVSSSSGRINAKTGHMTFYNPVYEHKGNTLSADSGYIYENEIKQQFFEAFGNVVITQPSGTVIYSDYLHYDAAVQLAKLTKNVRLVDRNSVLTTNFLTYNMRSKIGTYTGGGRIVTQSDTITSRNAFYFENTGDAYFRHKVIVRNPSVKVYTDSMRYNSISKDTYFYGPTNIKGNQQENLYTERGVYNTATGIANFNKNNLYTEGSRFLKGDSLHYEREFGIGKAFRNVVFVDTLDKFYAYGGKGEYHQGEESILMTDKPFIITVVQNDSDSIATDSTAVRPPIIGKEGKEDKKEKKQEEKKLALDNDNLESKAKNIDEGSTLTIKPEPKIDSVFMTADTLYSRMILAKEYRPLDLKLDRNGGQMLEEDEQDYGDDEISGDELVDTKTNVTGKTESESVGNTVQQKQKANKTTSESTPKQTQKQSINNNGEGRHHIEKTLKADSVLRQRAVVPIAGHADSAINKALKIAQQPNINDGQNDSTQQALSDTSRTRIVKAYYNVRLFKSDLQAVADSVYYGMQDSMFRFMGRPMIWAKDSQISADTIFMQIVNQKMDNALLKENAFMVNALSDSTKFNQLKGRKITAFFANNNIERLFVDGNAENLVFSENEKTKVITEMFHDRGGRIKVRMENRKIIDYITIKKVDQKVYPFAMVTQENEILPGFIWRPQDRPTSKEDLLNRKREIPKESNKQEDSKTLETKAEEIETVDQ